MFSYFTDYMKDVFSSRTALIGLVASFIILVSMCFNTSKKSGELMMRILNFIGSIACVVYAIMLGANGIGTFILNAILIIVNFVYMIKLIRNYRKK